MSNIWVQLVIVFALVVVNAAFAGTELALVSLREGQLQRLKRQSSAGAALARLAREPNQFLATIQVGITLAGFLASAFAATSLAAPLERVLGFLGDAANPVAIVLVTIGLSYFTLVFGELAPKRIAMQRAERWGLLMARPLELMLALTRPAVWMLSRSTNVTVRLFGADPDLQREEVTEEEIRDMLAVQTSMTPDHRQMLVDAFEIANRNLEQVLVPRGDVFVIDSEWTCDEALAKLADSGHSRAPVGEGASLDHVTGVVHLRQLLGGGNKPVSELALAIPVFPDSAKVLNALRSLQTDRTQMALVVDEHGGGAGIVTIEDLVEELVGEIYDETDPDLATVVRHEDGTIEIPGRFPIHDLPDIGIEVPDGGYTTVAGLVLGEIGQIPVVGDTVEIAGWTVTINAMEGRAVTGVLLRPVVVASEPL